MTPVLRAMTVTVSGRQCPSADLRAQGHLGLESSCMLSKLATKSKLCFKMYLEKPKGFFWNFLLILCCNQFTKTFVDQTGCKLNIIRNKQVPIEEFGHG